MTLRTYTLIHNGRKFELLMNFGWDKKSDWFVTEHFNRGSCYEPEETHVMLRVIRPGDTVIDVGANAGFFTVLMSQLVGPTGHVFAFEPGNNILPVLISNLDRNNCRNVNLRASTLWSTVDKLTFHLSADTSGGNALYDPGGWWENTKSREKQESYAVVGYPLDSYCYENVRLIKIDTEGADQRVLEGAAVLLETQKPPFILSEINPFGSKQLGCDTEEFRAYMRDFGYETFLIHGDGSMPTLVPHKTTLTHRENTGVLNILFSSLDAVAEAWPRAPYE